jgi:hypothetical protein
MTLQVKDRYKVMETPHGESDPHIDVALLLAGTAASCRS